MRITWITHLAMRDVCEQYSINSPVLGGWLETMKEELCQEKNIRLSIICIEKGDRIELKNFKKDNIEYYLIKTKEKAYYGKFSHAFKEELNRVVAETEPDIIHLHGTEFGLWKALDFQMEEKIPICISVQGLISVISERYYWAGLKREAMKWLEKLPIILQHRKALQRGILEKEIIQRYLYYLGRTDWDYAHIKALNSNAIYYDGKETVRDAFNKSKKWSFDNIKQYSIFCAGGYNVPLKGFHRVIEIFPQILDEYPEAHIYVPGEDLFMGNSLKYKIGYFRYLKRRIQELELKNHITFLGKLSAENMAQSFSKYHCYVLGSSIENSPNTLMEAMTMGTPCIAADVGGVQNFVSNGQSALLYRFEEKELLSYLIKKVFSSKELAEKLSQNARDEMAERKTGGQKLSDIYQKIYDDFSR